MSSKFCSLTLEELRTELRHRNAKVSGRKKELIERLEAYDRNANFGAVSTSLPEEYKLKLPDALAYVDLNSDKKIVPIDMDKLTLYLNTYSKQFDESAKNLYNEQYLCYLRLKEENGLCYAKSACRAEMRKSVSYVVDVSFTMDGHVHEAQCECAAGMGPHAHCKHVSAVVFGCVQFRQTGHVNVETTCTEKLQTFHHVKKYTGSPVKGCDIQVSGAEESACTSFDPRPPQYRNTDWYRSYVRNTCMSYAGISEYPISQILPPANIRGLSHDHDYFVQTHEDNFLKRIGLTGVSKEDCDSIEKRTRGQAQNEVWHAERKKRIQSSMFGTICKATERADLNKLARNMINPKTFSSKATNHGNKYEGDALREYEKIANCEVSGCGIFVSQTSPFLGSSPDAVRSDSVICEVKCPLTAANKQITTTTVPYLRVNPDHRDSFMLDPKHNYYFQVQGQLFCSGRQFCDFIVYTLSDIKMVRIQRDDDFIAKMLCTLQAFYNKYFEPELLRECFYKEL